MKKLAMSALVLLSGLQALQAKTNPQGIKSLKGCRPNVIFVLTDDQGMGDLSCMGNPILKTPHLDRFYEQSTCFADYHVSPTCAPTRSAIMSGRAPFVSACAVAFETNR